MEWRFPNDRAFLSKGGWKKILSLFGKTAKASGKPVAIAFVDYEHWYISMQRMYGEKPDIRTWRAEISKQYNVKDILFFGDFSNQSLRSDIPRIREVSSSIIETQNASSFHKKDYTDFIMLDHIYQRVMTYGEDTDVFIIFSGDGHFSSVASFLVNRCEKTVVVYGVRDCLSNQLANTASIAIEWPEEKTRFSRAQADRTDAARRAARTENTADRASSARPAARQSVGSNTAKKSAGDSTGPSGTGLKNESSTSVPGSASSGNGKVGSAGARNASENGRDISPGNKNSRKQAAGAAGKRPTSDGGKTGQSAGKTQTSQGIVCKGDKLISPTENNSGGSAGNDSSGADRAKGGSADSKSSKAPEGGAEVIREEKPAKSAASAGKNQRSSPAEGRAGASGAVTEGQKKPGTAVGAKKKTGSPDGARKKDKSDTDGQVKAVSGEKSRSKTQPSTDGAAVGGSTGGSGDGRQSKPKPSAAKESKPKDPTPQKKKPGATDKVQKKQGRGETELTRENRSAAARDKNNAARGGAGDRSVKGSGAAGTEARIDEELRRMDSGESDSFARYYRDILKNIRFYERNNTGKTHFRATYAGTVDSVCTYYHHDRSVVAVALDRMEERGYITLGSGFSKGSKSVTVNWDKVSEDGLSD